MHCNLDKELVCNCCGFLKWLKCAYQYVSVCVCVRVCSASFVHKYEFDRTSNERKFALTNHRFFVKLHGTIFANRFMEYYNDPPTSP